MFSYWLIVGALIHISSTSVYLLNTLKGKTKPNRMTFLMWAIAPLIGVAAALADGVGWAVLPVFMAGFGPFLIFLASFVNPNAYWKLGPFDYLCGFFSAVALVLWGITNEPVLAIVFAIISDAFAGWPTVVKAWKFPETENFGAYTGSTINQFLVFFVAPTFTFSSVAFPVYLISINLLILLGIYHKRLFPRALA